MNLKGSKTPRKITRRCIEVKVWREQVYERDNYKCRNCGSEEHLSAHHIKDWASHELDRIKGANGLTLCTRCHRRLEARISREREEGRSMNKTTVPEPPEATQAIPMTGIYDKPEDSISKRRGKDRMIKRRPGDYLRKRQTK